MHVTCSSSLNFQASWMVNLNICSTSAVVNNANKVQAHLQEVLRYACMHAFNHHLFRQVNEMDVTPNRLDRKVSYAQNYLDFQFLKEGLQYEFKLRYLCPTFLSLRSHYTVAELTQNCKRLGRLLVILWTHLSYLELASIKHFIDSKQKSVTNDTLDDVAATIAELKQELCLSQQY